MDGSHVERTRAFQITAILHRCTQFLNIMLGRIFLLTLLSYDVIICVLVITREIYRLFLPRFSIYDQKIPCQMHSFRTVFP